MKATTPRKSRHVVIELAQIGELARAVIASGHALVGPTRRDGAIVYDSITSFDELPIGWADDQDAGTYRLHPDGDRLFAATHGPHSWKKFLLPAVTPLWEVTRGKQGFTFAPSPKPTSLPLAFVGVRACDLAAIDRLDQIFLRGPYVDRAYQAVRETLLIIAVNCTRAGGTCFCASMGTGPKASALFDLAMTEVSGGSAHHFVVDIGSERGARLLSDVPHRDATAAEVEHAERLIAEAATRMGRTLDTGGLREAIAGRREHPHWDRVAHRCLACGNCTMVCPTCFCSTTADETDLCGLCSARRKMWDSCFTLEFSYIHGGAVRASVKSRYRQWLSHKLSAWVDQFGAFGCVGCGRCITWCPAQIDLTEEAKAVTGTPAR
jgi:ferredoxin